MNVVLPRDSSSYCHAIDELRGGGVSQELRDIASLFLRTYAYCFNLSEGQRQKNKNTGSLEGVRTKGVPRWK